MMRRSRSCPGGRRARAQALLPALVLAGVSLACLRPAAAAQIQAQTQVQTQTQAQQAQAGEIRKAEAVSDKVLDRVVEVGVLVATRNFTKAMTLLDEARGWRHLNVADRTTLWNATADAWLAQDERGKALAAYQEILMLPNVEPRFTASVLYAMAQIHTSSGNYREAVTVLERLERTAPPHADAVALRGQISHRLGNDRMAREALERAARLAATSGGLLNEADYRVLGQLQYEAGDKQPALRSLEILTRNWPSKTYFMLMAQLCGELNQNLRQIAVLEAALRNGWLTSETELRALAQLYLYYGVPYKAARLLEAGIDSGAVPKTRQNLELLSTGYLNAREFDKAIPPLLRAAELAKSGELYLRLLRLYSQVGDRENAVKAANAALALGGLKRPDELYVLKGMAEFDLGRLGAARQSFVAATKYKASAELARSWVTYIDNEESQNATR